MNVEFHSEANIEFLDAIEYYEKCERRLGEEFSLEVFSTIQKIKHIPIHSQLLIRTFAAV